MRGQIQTAWLSKRGFRIASPSAVAIYLLDFLVSAAASLRRVAMVAAEESLRLLFLGRRFVFVV
jgi:hypothetical protein